MKQAIGYIIENSKGEILLMLRDNKETIPYPNMWYIPGGVVEAGETIEQALVREIREEINLNVDEYSLFKVYHWEEKEEHIYKVHLELNTASINLNEGQEIRFFNPKDVLNMELAFHDNQIAKDFLIARK